MTVAVPLRRRRVPAGQADAAGAAGSVGAVAAWRWELTKLRAQLRVRAVAALCAVVPFGFVAVLALQSSAPTDTLFGRWVHQSGFAVPLVILNFAGMWGLPLLAAVVAGDVFSAEDHFGTWKTVLTRNAGRRQLFAGKLLAVATYVVGIVAVLAVASLLAGLLVGHQPLVGLTGQLVPAGRAADLVLASWATAVAPTLAFAAVAVVASVATRNSVAGIGVPVVLGLVMQLLALINGPQLLDTALLSSAFASWHGFWTTPGFTGPFWEGIAVSVLWCAACLTTAWLVFARRDIAVG